MNIVGTIRYLSFYCFIAVFFMFPRYGPGFFLLSFVLTFFIPKFKKYALSVLSKPVTWICFLFGLVYLASALYSNDAKETLSVLERKSTFILLPFFLPIVFRLKAISIKIIFSMLIGGVLLSFISNIGFGFYAVFVKNAGFNRFFGADFSMFFHTSYLAVAINLLLVYVFESFIKKEKANIIPLLLVASLILYVLVLLSKIGLVLLLINLVVFAIRFARKKGKKRYIILTLVGILLSVLLIQLVAPKINQRVVNMYNQLVEVDYSNKDAKLSSTGQRLVLWKATRKIISENPLLGVGAGDFMSELRKKTDEQGYVNMKKNLNSHQQFLQTYATAGIIALLILILIFGYIYFQSYMFNNPMLAIFGLNMFLFALTESMLETQAGVLIFLLFYYMFATFNSKRTKLA